MSLTPPGDDSRPTVDLGPPGAAGGGPEGAGEALGERLGRFWLRGVLGHGGMAVVYRAWDPTRAEEVALKVLRAGHQALPSQVARFTREAQTVLRLRHPHIIRVHEAGEAEGLLYLAMRLVHGPTLAAHMQGRALPPREAASLASQLARALEEAHRQGVVHRDVKPSNVLLGAEGAVLTDFGVVQDGHAEPLTISGQVLGTPAYMAPEQARGDLAAIGPASDQYALGVVLYEMCTGRQPFYDPSPQRALQRMLEGGLPDAATLGAPEALAALCRRAMARTPSARFADMGALAEALEALLSPASGGPLEPGG